MTDDGGEDAKVVCVPSDPRFDHIQNVEDLGEFLREEIEHFFTRYKDLEPNKEVTGSGWGDKAEAEKILEEAKARFK